MILSSSISAAVTSAAYSSSTNPSCFHLMGAAWTRAFRCVWMLEELGIPYTLDSTVQPRSNEARKYNPSGKVPILLELLNNNNQTNKGASPATVASGGIEPSTVLFSLTESTAINTYLGDCYPESGLVPSSLASNRDRAVYNELISCISTELDAQGLWIHAKHAELPEKVFGHFPGVVQAAEKQFHRINAVLAQRVGRSSSSSSNTVGAGPYLMGDRFTAADILYVHCLDWSKRIGWQGPWPAHLQDYRHLCHERPAYQRAKQLRNDSAAAAQRRNESKPTTTST